MDKVETITIPPDDTSDTIIPLIILILFVVFIGWILYLLINSNFKSTNPENPVNSDNRPQTQIACGPGQCGVNLLSGFKRCPIGDEILVIDPSAEVCNSRFVCDNAITPFALQSDGSTNINGVCEPNVECSCLRYSQCPEYILSVFTTSNGNPYSNLQGQRITFPQSSTYVTTNGVVTDQAPIQFTNPATTFCVAPLAWLPLSSPGCNFVSTANLNSMNYNDTLLCMGSIRGCSGLNGSPCLQGVLAFITDNPESLTQRNIVNAQLGCVRGEYCPCGTVAIFDTNYGNIVCRSLS